MHMSGEIFSTSRPSSITAQLVALAALNAGLDRATELADIYARRYLAARETLGEWMPAAPLTDFGTFYVWLDTTSSGRTGAEIASIARTAGIAISDGRAFAPTSPNTVRLALTANGDRLREALTVVRDALTAPSSKDVTSNEAQHR